MMSNKYPTHWLRRAVQAGLASLIAVAGLVTFSAAATVSTTNVVSGVAACAPSSGTGYTITWTVANTLNLNETGTVTAATGGLATVTPTTFTLAASGNGAGGAGSAPYKSATLTQTLPATASGTITLSTQATWSDNSTAAASGTVDLSTLSCGTTSGTTTTTTPTGSGSTGVTPKALIPAANGQPLSCSSTTIYNLTSQGGLYSLNTSTSVNTKVGTIGSSDMNSLGITADGTTAYAANQTPKNGTTTVYVENVTVPSTVTYTGEPATGLSILIAGAVDPVNGLYYYGGWNSAGTQFILFAFNPTTHTAAEAGTISPPNSTTYGAGDITFDNAGNLYILAGAKSTSNASKLVVAPGPIPTSGTSTIASSTLATIPANSGNFDGIAFTTSGQLFVQTTDGAFDSVNPNNGTVTSLPAQTGLGSESPYDLAGCSFNGTLQVEKNIVGRSVAGDQFTMTITGNGISSGNSGTTTGSSTGVQTGTGEIAGPIVGIPGTSYNVAETAASGSLANYQSTYACLNGTTPVTTSGNGTGTSFSLTFPTSSGNAGANVICTFTNTPAGFSVVKSATPAGGVVAGSSTHINYSLAVKNTSAITTGSPLVVTDTVPAGTTLVSGSPACSAGTPTCAVSVSGSTITWTIPAGVAASGSYTLSFAVTANAGDATGNVTNTASYTGPGCTTSPSCSTNTTTTPVTNDANFTVVKSATPAGGVVAGSGTHINYSLAVNNTGTLSNSTTPLVVTDTVPAGTTLVSGSAACSSGTPTCAVSVSGSTITWTIPAGVGPGGAYTLTFSVTANAGDATGTILNTAGFTGPGCTTSPNCSTNTTTTPVTNNANFTVVKSATPAGGVVAGSSTHINYTLLATNTGASTSTSPLVVTDTVPAGTTLVSGSAACSSGTPTCAVSVSGSTITWTIPAGVAASGSYTLTFAVTANAGDPTGNILNTGSFTGPGCTTSPNCSTNTTTTPVTNNAGFSVVKSATPAGGVVAGSATPINYTLLATNTGSSTSGSALVVTDTVPAGTTLVGGSAACSSGTPTCAVSVSGSTITWTIPSGVASGASYTLTFSVTANAGDTTGTITNTAGFTGPGCTTSPNCSTNTTTTPVTNNANFTVVKSATPAGGVVAGSSTHIDYTLLATNTGTSNSTAALVVTDTVPAGTTLVTGSAACSSGTPTCAVSVSGSTITWTIPSGVASGASYSLTFSVTANAGDATGTVQNTATFTGPGCTTSPNCSTNTTTTPVTNNANFTVVKSATPAGGVVAGSSTHIDYTLLATNTGTSNSTAALVVTDTVPAGTTLVTGSAACEFGHPDVCRVGLGFDHHLDHSFWCGERGQLLADLLGHRQRRRCNRHGPKHRDLHRTWVHHQPQLLDQHHDHPGDQQRQLHRREIGHPGRRRGGRIVHPHRLHPARHQHR